jgi:hypothetical protein
MKYEKEDKQVKQEVTAGYACDVCNTRVTGNLPKDWFSFSHGHCEWGNDSIDSVEYFYVCSVACFKTQLEASIYEIGDRSCGSVGTMPIPFAKNLLEALK